ncbi:MAG TPA: excinuclease ABC subunit A, partial [Planctomycetes bacterium]|nr:excinuclease ABC subunit A [Planctomycetota bacterium]
MTGRTKAPKANLRDIELRGVAVHNLQNIDIDFQHNQLIAFCGVSGSGKTSLALDTLYAEGQRRYIESFSAYTRQFLDRLEKPTATSLTGIPPAVAVTRKTTNRNSRSTIGTATETANYLRLLFAKIGTIVCPQCVRTVQQDSAESVAKELTLTRPQVRCMVGFTATINHQDLLRESEVTDSDLADLIEQSLAGFLENGFVRVIAGDVMVKLDDQMQQVVQYCCEQFARPIETVQLIFVVDRLSVPTAAGSPTRFQDSLETAFAQPAEMCVVLVEQDANEASQPSADSKIDKIRVIDGRSWWEQRYSASYQCKSCEKEFSTPQPRLYSFNSPLGACPTCEGFGNVIHNDMELIVPDESKTISMSELIS